MTKIVAVVINDSEFAKKLAESGMTRQELMEEFKVTRQAVAKWHRKMPGYLVAYLNLKIKNRALKEDLERCEGNVETLRSGFKRSVN